MNAQRTTVFKLLLSLWMAMHVLASDALAQSGTCANSAGNPQCAAAGNPINVITGNKYQRDVDMAPLPGPMGLEIVRYYNSKLSGVRSRTGILGRGWRLSYEVRLAAIADTVQVVEADGSRLIFARDPLHPNVCSNLDPANGSVEVRRTRDGDEYVWHKSDGRRLSFDTRGNLVQILAPTGEFVSMQHDARGWLVQVTDPQGRSLRLNYLERREAAKGLRFSGVQSIESPVGRFSYRYGSALPKGADSADRREVLANLVEVSMPDATLRRYHFEDPRFPTLLTGISVQAQDAQGKPRMQRYATFGYDGNAMAVLSTHAGGADGITLDNSAGGRTVLTNSLGQKTVYQYGLVAGQLRLQEVRGAGCALCGEMNVRYGYDRLGRISDVTRLDGNGTPLQGSHTDYDYYGRPHLVSRIAYRDGKPAKPEWQQRFEYAAGGALAPTLIARPSVVPGREYLTRIRYGTGPANAVLPVEISETGYIPTYDGNGAAQQIARTMRYGYDGNGQRTVTDGPLANAASAPGPDNSDITRTDYDPKTRLPLRTIAPGGRVTEVLERDAALRPVRIRTSDGYRAQTASIRSNWRGQPEEIRIEAALLVRDGAVEGADGTMVRTFGYRYDAQGRLESMTAPGGLVTRFVYDAAGRLTHRILPDGSRLVTRQDTEGRLASEARYAGDEGAEALASLRYQYDAAGRVSRVDDGLGLVKRVEYTAFDQVARLSNGAGSASRFAYDDHGLLILRTDAAGTPDAASTRMAYDSHGRPVAVTDPNGVRTERRYDDFGRKVFEASPDRGITLYTHDAAGRIMARIDESGFTTRYGYDQAGRLVTMGVDRQAALVRYSYQGQYLVQMTGSPDGDPRHLAERVGYAYDAFGQQVRERRWIARVDDAVPGIKRVAATTGAAGGLTFETKQAFDEAGNLVRRVLPDGHRIEYRYTPAGSAAGAGRPGQLVAILFDGRIVVSDIAQSTAGGLSGYTHGNGVRQRIALDGRGRIRELRAETSSRRPAEGALARWWGALRTWMGGSQDRAGERGGYVVYAQMNSYDEADRLTTIVRGTAAAPQTERYGYDGQNRLVHVEGKGGRTDYAYDAGGNRIAEKGAGVDHRYGYQRGSNRLAALTSGDAATPGAPRLDNAWLYHPTGVPVAQLVVAGMQRTASPAAGSRRIEYNGARRPVAVYGGDGRPLARYFYNTQGERMAKVVYGGAGTDTTYSLYSDQRLAAETDGAGRITAHYIYLYGRPVAKVSVVPADSLTRRAWRAVRTAGGLLPDARPDAGDSIATVYAIHTDHLGTPRTVTDEDGRPVWQAEADAFGKMRVLYAAPSGSGRPFDMPLRLPGQVYDAETGLNQNYYRDYNPALGRYMTADPVGLAGGTNPYAYVGSNPLTRIDPLGLYQSDVHFYMTYFLAIVAGMDAADARMMALATQYIDNNPATYPLNEESVWTKMGSITWNQDNLARYHFVLWTQKEGEKAIFSTDKNLDDPLPKSPQLQALQSYAFKADPNGCPIPKNTSLQFMGEFLHAFEDTYAHRKANNEPFGVNGGFGHGLYGSDPDYTYDHETPLNNYSGNEYRTLVMERAVLQQIKDYMTKTGYKPTTGRVGPAGEALDVILRTFNGCRADEGSDEDTLEKKGVTQSNTASDCNNSDKPGQLGPKIAILSNTLNSWGYSETLKWYPDKDGGTDGYNVTKAGTNRTDNFKKLDPANYPAANLSDKHK